jgi:hypothetical protein
MVQRTIFISQKFTELAAFLALSHGCVNRQCSAKGRESHFLLSSAVFAVTLLNV